MPFLSGAAPPKNTLDPPLSMLYNCKNHGNNRMGSGFWGEKVF